MRRIVLLLIVGLAPLIVFAQEPAAEQMACADCHADQAKVTAHSAIPAKNANAICESCHGNGAAHIEGGGDKEKITVPRGRTGADNICMNCHDTSSGNMSRRAGMHANSAAVNCLTCHSVHAAKSEPLLTSEQSSLCSSCHTIQAASMRNKPFSHRMGRGGMECSTCHDPHGRRGRESLRQTASGESACVTCHSEKRNLFVFQHGASSVGDCSSCHENHGSSNARQLKRATVQQLCIECHSPIAGVTLASQPPSFHNISQARFQNCTTCHTAIHGSNRSPQLLK